MFRPTIGALWIHKDKNGQEYLSGNIVIDGSPKAILCFKRKKTGEKEPDYDIQESMEKRKEN